MRVHIQLINQSMGYLMVIFHHGDIKWCIYIDMDYITNDDAGPGW